VRAIYRRFGLSRSDAGLHIQSVHHYTTLATNSATASAANGVASRTTRLRCVEFIRRTQVLLRTTAWKPRQPSPRNPRHQPRPRDPRI